MSGTRSASPGHLRSHHPAVQPGATAPHHLPAPVAASPPGSRLLKKSFAQIQPQSDNAMTHFFAALFARHPDMHALFPHTAGAHRRRVLAAITHYVRTCDQPEAVARWLSELALDHRKYGVTEDHYQRFCDTLLASFRMVAGAGWTPAADAAWRDAFGYMSAVMADAARGAAGEPAWWLAEVTGHERRRPDLAVLTLRADGDRPLRYRPGQHVSVLVPRAPRVWREYSIANAPALDGLLRLHVRAVPGGAVSTALVHQTRVGDTLLIGRARGALTVDALSSRTLLCVAGGTGLAPVKAIVEALASAERPGPRPDIRVLVGARTADDLYDLHDLWELAATCPSLDLVPVISHDPCYRGERGMLAEVAARHLPSWPCDVVVSGPTAMAAATAAAVSARAPRARLHLDLPAF